MKGHEQMTKFTNAVNRIEQKCPPIWMMRQAGRYQPSYMKIKETYNFEQMCKLPQIASKVAMLPIDDFDFDAAILFSDILWHVEGLGIPLKFDPAPKFEFHLSEDNWKNHTDFGKAMDHLSFQQSAMESTREKLPESKSLIGFIGGPWSVLNYAIGPNKVSNDFKTMYLKDVIIPLMARSIRAQKIAGADVVMIFDSGLHNISKNYYETVYLPMLQELSDIGNVGYYSRALPKGTLPKVKKMNWCGIGIDSTENLARTLKTHTNGFVQGNFDESNMLLENKLYHYELDKWLDTLDGVDTTGWICGLGHGIHKTTPTANVQYFIDTIRNRFS
jgi:uroporphyrinogen decarboxylase